MFSTQQKVQHTTTKIFTVNNTIFSYLYMFYAHPIITRKLTHGQRTSKFTAFTECVCVPAHVCK